MSSNLFQYVLIPPSGSPTLSLTICLSLPVDVVKIGEHQGADALANLIYGTQAFDMVFKYPIAEHLRKVPLNLEQTSLNVDSNGAALSEKGATTAQEGQGLINNNNSATSGADAAAEAANKDLEAGAVSTAKIELEAKLEMYRRRFKKALLKEGLIIEEEPNIDGEEMFVKVYTPFWRLCVEAQRLRFKVELIVSFFFSCLLTDVKMKVWLLFLT